MTEVRVCKVCKVEKPIEAFWVIPKCTGGRSPRCGECTKARQHELMTPEKLAKLADRPQTKSKALFEQGLKCCAKCNEVKPLTDFYHCPTRFTSQGGYQGRCKICNNAANREWRENNRDRRSAYFKEYEAGAERKFAHRQQRRARSAASPRQVMQITLRHGLRRRPTENAATIDDLMRMFEEQGRCCAVTGITMTWAQGTVLPTSISLDRISSDGGYSADNLRLVCHCVNAFKGRMSDDEMFSMALAIVANMKKPKLRLVS